MNIVLDTNVLVSALWSLGSKAGEIVTAALANRLTVCYDHRILEEYDRVLHYRKFQFTEWEINSLLEPLIKNGLSIIADRIVDIPFTDESDRKFFEVARFCHAPLVTGNMKHYPDDPLVMPVSDFYEQYIL